MKYFIAFLCTFFFSFASAQLQSPEAFLGYELGTSFSRHHQVVDYINHVSETSPYAQKKEYGKTYEGRLLQVVFLSSPENLERLEEIRKTHLASIDGSKTSTSEKDFSVVWLSYNVHGNESTSTEAAMKTLHNLVTEKQAWLENLIVVIDPCINPDGRDRYVNWYKENKSTPFDSDPTANEHFEEWPRGRYNHYYFDLNRDWAWLSQIESQQRLPLYMDWMPQIHVDFHEQGVNSPYYFAPAVEPYHEVITDFQRDFQQTIAENHASYFDKEGWRYFTDEVFDLLYPGYGDTYPMFNGAIGMTYEQGGSGRAGLSIATSAGNLLTLKDRIAHHHTTGLSTVEVAYNNVEKLNREFEAYHTIQKTAKFNTYAFRGHPDKIEAFKKILQAHRIPVRELGQKITLKGIRYGAKGQQSISFEKNTLIVPGNEKKSALVQALLEPQTQFSDSLTYDITSWSLPYAYGLEGIASKQTVKTVPVADVIPEVEEMKTAYAYAAERKSIQDGIYLGELLKAGLKVFYNEMPLTNGGKKWEVGSLFVLRGENPSVTNLAKVMQTIAEKTKQDIVQLSSGFSSQGPDLGSNSMRLITNTQIGILKSDGASPSGYGEIWHFFEQQIHYPIRQLHEKRLSSAFLEKIDVLIVPPGYYRNLFDSKGENDLSQWLKKGGRIVAIGSALNTFTNHDMFSLERIQGDKKEENATQLAYNEVERDNISSVIYGSIFNAKVDASHPMAAGFTKEYATLKTNERAFGLIGGNGTVAYLPKNAVPLAGFTGADALEKQSESLLFGTEKIGRGSVVYLVDNPLYRSFWENGKLWLLNALFF